MSDYEVGRVTFEAMKSKFVVLRFIKYGVEEPVGYSISNCSIA